MKPFEVGKTYQRADGSGSIRIVANIHTEVGEGEGHRLQDYPLVGVVLTGEDEGEVACFTEAGGSFGGRKHRDIVHPITEVVRWTFAVSIGSNFDQVYEFKTEQEAIAEHEDNTRRHYRCSEIVRLVWKVPL